MRTTRILLGLGAGLAIALPTLGAPLAAHAATGGTATLTVNEVVNPCLASTVSTTLCGDPLTSDPGVFNIGVTDPGDATATPPATATSLTFANQGNGGGSGAQSISTTDAGTNVTIAETAGTSTVLADYTLVYSCSTGSGFALSGAANVPFSFPITNGQSITCTVTATRSNAGGPFALSLLGSGSDTTQFMMHGLDGLYMFSPGCQQIALSGTKWYDFSCLSPDPTGTVTTENYEHDQVHEAYFLGSGSGIHQLCNNGIVNTAHIDYARSSRAPSGDCHGLHFVAYARDGISVEAFDGGTTASGVHGISNQVGTCAGSSGASAFCLSQQDLKNIFVNCTTTNWSQVGGQNVPIVVYTPQPSSGTRQTFDGFLGGSSSTCPGSHVIDENSNSQIAAADVPGAIFPFSFGIWSTQVNFANGAELAAIDNVIPSAGTIGPGTFPYSRFLFNVFCPAGSGGANCASNPVTAAATAVTSYVGEEGWICKTASHHTTDIVTGANYRTDIFNVITQNGFVPLLNGVIGGGDTHLDFCRLTVS